MRNVGTRLSLKLSRIQQWKYEDLDFFLIDFWLFLLLSEGQCLLLDYSGFLNILSSVLVMCKFLGSYLISKCWKYFLTLCRLSLGSFAYFLSCAKDWVLYYPFLIDLYFSYLCFAESISKIVSTDILNHFCKFSYNTFVLSSFTCRPLIYFELVLMYNER